MSTKFQIKTDKLSEPMTLDQVVDYKMKHLDEKFEVIELFNRRKTDKRMERHEYMKTLTDAQHIALAQGKRKVKYSEEIGWYLLVIGDEEAHYTSKLSESRRQDKIRASIKEALVTNINELHEIYLMENRGTELEISFEEFLSMINKISFAS